MPRFGAVSPKQIIAQAADNDASLTSINLSANALFKMKTNEYCKLLAEALESNTNVKELILNDNELTDADCEWIKHLLETNKSVTSLSLNKNKFQSEGCGLIAQGLAKNDTLVALDILNNGPFGEGCMDHWLKAFNDNVTLYDVKWRLNSRSSFALNTAITRNRSINRLRKEGKDWESLLPDHLRSSKPASTPTPPPQTEEEPVAAPATEEPEDPPAAEEPATAADEPAPEPVSAEA